MTTGWNPAELDRIGAAEELDLASRRPDGTVRPYVTIWVVRSGDELYVRSAYGVDNPWYRRAVAAGLGRIRIGDLERDVTFSRADPAAFPGIDAAYHGKYDRHGPAIVGTVVGPGAAPATLRLSPASGN